MIRPRFRAALFLVAAAGSGASSVAPAVPLHQKLFELAENAEAIATVTAACEGCNWGLPGHEAAVLRLEVDGRYSQHLFLTRGSSRAEYRVLLGSFQAGRHTLTLTLDSKATARCIDDVSVAVVEVVSIAASHPDHAAISGAPILYARPNTLGRFTDVPLLMWYERETTGRGSRIRYSVVFSNEDGGTPAEKLLATWGRLTDIEYIYGIEFDRSLNVIEEAFQGKDHEIVPFRGQHEGRHPLLYVVTDNNMVSAAGVTEQRFAPAPTPFSLRDVSREEVMDENPWIYGVTAQEARREGRVAASPVPGSKKIFDPSRYAVLEACAAPEDSSFATFTFSLGVASGRGVTRRYDSSVGVRDFRISRSPHNFPNGCFRGAVALPKGVRAADVTDLQVRAHTRPPRKGEEPKARRSGPARLRRVNKLFLMSAADLPERSLFSWRGEAVLALDGEPVTLGIKPIKK
jgi:hypothetical protein